MKKAVFLDRDGVINDDTGHYYIYRPSDFVLNKGIVVALQKLTKAGFLLIVISNQGGIAKGIYTRHDVEQVHEKMKKELEQAGIFLTEIYYCPHHPSVENCLCRKPGSLLLEKALARYQIDPAQSFFIGDSEHDIEAARKTGIRGILVPKNTSLEKICDDITGNL